MPHVGVGARALGLLHRRCTSRPAAVGRRARPRRAGCGSTLWLLARDADRLPARTQLARSSARRCRSCPSPGGPWMAERRPSSARPTPAACVEVALALGAQSPPVPAPMRGGAAAGGRARRAVAARRVDAVLGDPLAEPQQRVALGTGDRRCPGTSARRSGGVGRLALRLSVDDALGLVDASRPCHALAGAGSLTSVPAGRSCAPGAGSEAVDRSERASAADAAPIERQAADRLGARRAAPRRSVAGSSKYAHHSRLVLAPVPVEQLGQQPAAPAARASGRARRARRRCRRSISACDARPGARATSGGAAPPRASGAGIGGDLAPGELVPRRGARSQSRSSQVETQSSWL